jgi:hypothetical protein
MKYKYKKWYNWKLVWMLIVKSVDLNWTSRAKNVLAFIPVCLRQVETSRKQKGSKMRFGWDKSKQVEYQNGTKMLNYVRTSEIFVNVKNNGIFAGKSLLVEKTSKNSSTLV